MQSREIESAILRIFDGPAEKWEPALEQLCASHPDHAQAIRARADAIRREILGSRPAGTGPVPAAGSDGSPSQIGPYRILDLLGEGGMGTVYLAEQKQPVRRRAALKVIKLGMDSKAVLTRFEAERRALAMMEHSCIATVFDAGLTEHGQPYFAMEYVKGIPITDYCDQNKLTLKERIELFQKVCSGVQHAHLKGVMHRDLKASNVLVTLQDGLPLPKIIDFGLAKATDHHLVEATLFTEQGQVIGTPEYMSPEQAGLGGLDVDTRTDIYSLGVLLYELLVGELPFSRKELRNAGYMEMQRVIREQEPVKPSTRITTAGASAKGYAAARRLDATELRRKLRGDLDWIVLKALEKDRTRRYETALELAADLQRHLTFEPVLAAAPGLGYRVRKLVRRHRTQIAAAAAVLLALVTGLVLAVIAWTGQRAAQQALRQALRVVDADRLDAAEATAATLVPPWPGQVRPMMDWLDEWRTFLAERVPAIEASLAELRSRATASGSGESTGPIVFTEPADHYLHERLDALLRRIQQFQGPDGTMARVRERLELARTVEQESIVAHRAAWQRALATLASSSRYSRFGMTEQMGLVPLGADRDSRLQEFAHLGSGRLPLRDADTGKLDLDEDTGIVFVLLPGGSIQVGAQRIDPGKPNFDGDAQANEGPVRRFETGPFFLAKHELTQGQWLRLGGGRNPSRYAPGRSPATLTHPVESVSWRQAAELLRIWGLDFAFEEQWEYGCRAETETPWPQGADLAALGGGRGLLNVADLAAIEHEFPFQGIVAQFPGYRDGCPSHASVGSFPANSFGLHETNGNVWEWCRRHPAPGEPEDGATAAARGGSFADGPLEARSASRRTMGVDAAYQNVGLRVARKVF